MSITLTRNEAAAPACVMNTDLYQNPLLEDPASATTVHDRRQQLMMARKAESLCLECPLMIQCLYQAVVVHDVAGYAAGTTQRQRLEIRSRLRHRVDPEDLNAFAGTPSGRQVDHDEVLRLRSANPAETLEALAARLGCSLSTVKRHLRKARRGDNVGRSKPVAAAPSVDQVLDAFSVVVRGDQRRTPAVRSAGRLRPVA